MKKTLLYVLLLIIVLLLSVTATVLVTKITATKEIISNDRAREQPSVGGKISITITNETQTSKNAT